MAVVRKNIISDQASRDMFCLGVNLLKQDFASGVTTADLGFTGTNFPVSTYDQFVLWHYVAMNTPTLTSPTDTSGRNSAHRGPIFAPWHRFMLLLFEQHLRRVLSEPTFGLPYWDWAADGDLQNTQQQINAALWKSTGIGGTGNPVTTGPFAFDPNPQTNSFRVFFAENVFTGQLGYSAAGRGLSRALGADNRLLPLTSAVKGALSETEYDAPDWDAAAPKFRNRLEGWRTGPTGTPPGLHNMVHVWVGGDMSPGTSPNDPVFYLNHCNVDRVWEGWMTANSRTYLPTQATLNAPVGHRLKDTITSLVTTITTTPEEMLDVTTFYTYDVLPQP
jgi:tyrosinase